MSDNNKDTVVEFEVNSKAPISPKDKTVGETPMEGDAKDKSGAERHQFTPEEIMALVLEAKFKLNAWIKSNGPIENAIAFSNLGANEGLYRTLCLAVMDESGDNVISAEEADKFNEGSSVLVDAHLNSLANGAIVTALIFSVIYPTAYSLVLDHNAGVFEILEYISLELSVMCSITSIFMAAAMYTHISFFMPTLKLKLWYIEELGFLMPILELMKNTALCSLTCALMFQQLYVSVYPLNLIAIAPLCGVFLAFFFLFGYTLLVKINPKLFEYTKEILANYDASTVGKKTE